MPLKRAVILFALCLNGSCIFAQSGTYSSGMSIYATTGEMSFTVGEFNHLSSVGLNSMTSGVLQAYYFIPLGILEESKITIWPNPVVDNLFLKIDQAPIKGLYYQLFDIYGGLLEIKNIKETTTIIDMKKYQIGSYIFHILFMNQHLITHKIIKN